MASSQRAGSVFRWQDLESLAAGILLHAGVSRPDAETAASLLVRTDARGYATHGLSRLKSYREKLASGEFVADAQPEATQSQSFLRVNANQALGHVAGPWAVDKAVALTADSPVVICSLQRTGHLGALGLHVLRAAEAGRVALLVQSTPPLMSIPGGRGPMMGNNPLAMAAPRPDGCPIVVDMACSVAARGNILLADKAGEELPEGWALDGQGRPTTDPRSALLGSLLPFGGTKGLMIATMVEILAGSLSGMPYEASIGGNGQVRSAPGSVNAFLMVMNPALMNGASEYAVHMTDWTSHYQDQGGPDARLPGARAAEQERRSRTDGVGISAETVDELSNLAQSCGVPMPEPVRTHRKQ